MSVARDEILRRVRASLGDVPADEAPGDVTVARAYRQADERPHEQLVELLAQRITDYGAQVRRVPAGEVAAAVANACAEMGLHHLAVPPGLPPEWRPEGVALVEDDALSARELDEIGAALTGAAAAIAETGTVVLDGQAACGRRVLTLVPDHHICVVAATQIAGQVPEAITALSAAVAERGVPVTFVSGASATSDIELSRVEGVHGPRHLLVLIAE